jgi:hypothetical protein
MLALVVAVVAVLVAGPAAAAPPTHVRLIQHHQTEIRRFADDICGPRASWTTFHTTLGQLQVVGRSDGSFAFHETAVFTYDVDFDDPALPDVSGRGTEVNHFVLAPGGTFVASTTFRDFFGEVRIFVRFHLTEVNGTTVVERDLLDVTGCPAA